MTRGGPAAPMGEPSAPTRPRWRSTRICASFLPDSVQSNIIKSVKKIDDFEIYQNKCKSILQKIQDKQIRNREMRDRHERDREWSRDRERERNIHMQKHAPHKRTYEQLVQGHQGSKQTKQKDHLKQYEINNKANMLDGFSAGPQTEDYDIQNNHYDDSQSRQSFRNIMSDRDGFEHLSNKSKNDETGPMMYKNKRRKLLKKNLSIGSNMQDNDDLFDQDIQQHKGILKNLSQRDRERERERERDKEMDIKRATNADYKDRVATAEQQSFVDNVAQQKIKALEQQVQQLVQQKSIISKFIEECFQHQNQNAMPAMAHEMMMHPQSQLPMHMYGAMPQQNFPGQQLNIDMLTANQGPQQPPIGIPTQGPPPPVFQGGPPQQHFETQGQPQASSTLRRPQQPPQVQNQQIQKQGQAGAPNHFIMGQLGQNPPSSGTQQNDKPSQERQQS